MSFSAPIARVTVSLLLLAGAGSVMAANNTNALLGASEPVVLELSDSSISSQSRPTLLSATNMASIAPAKITAQRLPSHENRGFDWSTLISLGFGLAGLLWIRRRTADL